MGIEVATISEAFMRPCCDRMEEELERTCAHNHAQDECPDVLIGYIWTCPALVDICPQTK